MPLKILPGIHGLRALAAAAIVLYHVAMLISSPPPTLSFVGFYFHYGVPLFFVLSGFSLCYTTTRTIGTPDWINDYVIKRIWRIAPLFYAFLIFRIIYQYARWNHFDPFAVIVNSTFMYNFIPGMHESIVAAGWTIGVEMIFYALLPVLLVCIRGFGATLAFCVASIAISISARALMPTIDGLPANYWTLSFISNLQYFAIGVLAYRIVHLLQTHDVNGRVIDIGGFAGTIAFLMVAVPVPRTTENGMNTPFWGLLFGVLCVWQALRPGFVNASRFFVYYGERSYSLYLIHPMVILLPRKHWQALDEGLRGEIGGASFIVIAIMVLVATFTLAPITYRWIEVPGIRFGSRLIRHRAEKANTISGAVPERA